MNSIHMSQAQRDALDQNRRDRLQMARTFNVAATPQAAANVGQISALHPLMSGTSAVALTANNIPATSEQVAQLAQAELETRETLGPVDAPGEGWWDDLTRGLGEYVIDPVKGTTRWGMMGLMAVYESTVGGSLIRAAKQAGQDTGMSFGDALYEQQPFLTRALADVFRDPAATWNSVWEETRTRDEEQEALLRSGQMQQVANVGSGFFPASTVDPEVEAQVMERSAAYDQTLSGLPTNERYSKKLEQSPQIWREAVEASSYQAALGSPLTNQGYADREGVMFEVNNIMNPSANFKTPYSPGRFAAATIWEPGTDSFSRASGVGDISAQIFLDPMNMIGATWAKWGIKGRTLKAVNGKVSGVADTILDTSKAADPTGFRGLIAGERNPVKAFGGELIEDDLLDATRAAVNEAAPGWKEMLDDGVAFNNPDDYRAWKDMKNRVEAAGGTFDDIDQVAIIDGLSDETVSLLEDTKLQIGDIGRQRGPTDVPEAFYGEHPVRDFSPRKKVANGVYEVNGTTITKDGRRWVIDGSDEKYTSLAKAEAALRGPELSPTARRFADEFDDFYAHNTDELNSIDGTNRAGQQRTHHGVSKNMPEGGNAKVRVYGRTMDLSGSKLPDNLDPGIVAVLKRNGLWDESTGFTGFADEVVSDIPEPVIRKFAGDGYGKIKVGDDEWIILDEMIGGSKSDPMGRMFFADGKAPISRNGGFEGASNLTPNQVNEQIQWLQDIGRHGLDDAGNLDASKLTRDAMDDFRRVNAERIDEARRAAGDGKAFGPTIDGNRPALDPTEMVLEGRRKQRFIDDLARMSKMDDAPRRIDRALKYFDRNRINVPRRTRRALVGAKGDHFKIERALVDWIDEVGGSVVLQGGTRYGKLRLLDNVIGQTVAGQKARGGRGAFGKFADQSGLSRRFSMMVPQKSINMVDDPDHAYVVLDSLLPNYNVRRGQDAIEYIDGAGKTVSTRAIDDVMADMLTLEVGDKAGAYQLMGDYAQILFAQGVTELGDKVPTNLIREVTSFFDDVGRMHVYNTERMGMVELAESTGDMLRVGGTGQYQPGVNFTTEAWSGAMSFPNRQQVKRVMNYQGPLGTIANFVAAKKVYKADAAGGWTKMRKAAKKAKRDSDGLDSMKAAREYIRNNSADIDIVDRAGVLVARSAINKLWKPMVLLRGAWTVRIMIDDQMRVAAEGFDTIFNHPLRFINYAMSQPDGMKSAFKTGFFDLKGTRVSLDNIDEVAFGKFYQDAMTNMSDGVFGRGAYGHKFSTPIKKGQRYYSDGLSNRIAQLQGDEMNSLLASSKADDPVDEVVEWLMGNRPDLQPLGMRGEKYRKNLEQFKGDNAELSQAILDGDFDVLHKIVRNANADLHRTTGGVVLIDDGAGNYRHYSDKESLVSGYGSPAERAESNEFLSIIKQRGDQELLDIVANGTTENMKYSLRKASDGTLSNDGLLELRTMLRKKVADAEPDIYPPHVYGPDPEAGKYPEGIGATYDKAVSNFFDFFMSKPSNWLSRSPVFEQAYWRHVGETMPFMDNVTQKHFMGLAENAGMGSPVRRAMKRTRDGIDPDGIKSARMSPAKKGELNELIEAIDEQAKAMGMAQVERTLFDLSTKRNISDSLSLIFPFVEAWGEFLSRWSKLAVYGDRNIKTMNRLQQGINGLRESDPFSANGDQGFFHQNEHGDEVFSYPSWVTKGGIHLNNVLNDIPVVGGALFGEDVDPSMADQLSVTGSVESMNFASSVIPGFGPAVQIASQTVLNDNPRWDEVKKVIAPFGEVSGPSGLAPAWVKRLMSANKHPDTQLNATYMATVQDTLRVMQMNGEFNGVTSPEDIKALVAEAEERAKALLMVRSAATFMLPSAPSYTFQTEDQDGQVWAFTQLGQEYNTIKYDEAGGDDTKAFEIFTERFGFSSAPFMKGRSYKVKQRSATVEGFRFERENRGLFEEYDATAMFLGPYSNENSEYAYGRHLELLKQSAKENWTPEQNAALVDKFLGDTEMEYLKQGIDWMRAEDREQYDLSIQQAQVEIQNRHPYWGRAIEGQREGVTDDQQQAEVERWMTDSKLKGRPVVEAARAYLAERERYIEVLVAEGMTLSGEYTADQWKTEITIAVRSELRAFAERLSTETPEFEALWENVYASEVSQQHDGWEPERVDFYGEDLFESTLGYNPNEEPRFSADFRGASKSGAGSTRLVGV